MRNGEQILESIRRDPDVAALLWDVCDVDLSRAGYYGPVRLLSGLPLEDLAGDYTGGAFFLCGEPGSFRPVLYASSEGQAGVIGRDLAAALTVTVGLPSWRDCLKFSGNGDLAVMQAAAAHLDRDEKAHKPDLRAKRTELAAALALDLASVPVLLARLHDAVAGTAPDYLFTDAPIDIEESDENLAFESLLGPWTPQQNPRWR